MRTVMLTKADYDEIVYGAMGSDSPKTMKDLRVCAKILTKLEEHGVSVTERMVNPNGGPPIEVEVWRMSELSVELGLEDAEADYLHARLLAVLPQLAAHRSRHLIPLIEALEKISA